MRPLAAAITALLLYAPVVPAADTDADALYTQLRRMVDKVEGHPLNASPGDDMMATNAAGYINGFMDGMLAGEQLKKAGSTGCVPTLTPLAEARIILKYIDDHPASRGKDAFSVTLSAYLSAFPCLR